MDDPQIPKPPTPSAPAASKAAVLPKSQDRGASDAAHPHEGQPGNWREKALQEAWKARELLVPACFSGMVGEENLPGAGAKVYFNSFLRDAGDPTDPVEKILLEQLLIAHHRVAQLHLRAEQAASPEQIRIFNAAAIRLLGEIRRTALAIRQYRLPPSTRTFQVVRQQNVVASGEQTVTYTDQSANPDKVSMQCRSELKGNATKEPDHEHDTEHPESTPRRRWAAERPETTALDR